MRSAGSTVSASRHFTNGRVNMADWMLETLQNEGTFAVQKIVAKLTLPNVVMKDVIAKSFNTSRENWLFIPDHNTG